MDDIYKLETQKPKSILIFNYFHLASYQEMPCKFHRLMQKLFFGIEWKKYEEK